MNALIRLKNASNVVAPRAIAMAAAFLVNVVLVVVYVFTIGSLHGAGVSLS